MTQPSSDLLARAAEELCEAQTASGTAADLLDQATERLEALVASSEVAGSHE